MQWLCDGGEGARQKRMMKNHVLCTTNARAVHPSEIARRRAKENILLANFQLQIYHRKDDFTNENVCTEKKVWLKPCIFNEQKRRGVSDCQSRRKKFLCKSRRGRKGGQIHENKLACWSAVRCVLKQLVALHLDSAFTSFTYPLWVNFIFSIIFNMIKMTTLMTRRR